MLVDKVKNSGLNDESRLTFNYRNVHKDIPKCAFILASKVHDYLSDPRHEYFLSADIKHKYFAIKTHPTNKYVFAFYINGIS
jgi:response regulator RpfG family c-di-GMP phosphodiesterase